MTKAREMAQFINQIQYSDLPTPVVAKAKEIALNSWGVQLAASTLPWSKGVYRYILSEGGAPQSTVINYGMKTSAVNAVLANGSFGHGFELDDSHNVSSVKGGCVAVPTALAVAEQRFNNGREVIAAIVAGFELMIRVGLMCRDVRPKRGYHATAFCGPFGAAAVAGKLHGLNEEQLVHAVGYAATLASGLGETPATGRGHMKRLFGGFAAAAGMRAALLAKEGLTGPETMMDGKRGFCNAYGDTAKTDLLTKGLGTDWEILKVHYKIYAQDGYIQPMTQALDKIRKANPFNHEEIEEVRIGTSRAAHDTVVGAIREPKDLTSAQFSAYFSLAMFLIKGGAMIKEYEDAFGDPEVMALSKRIHLSVDEEIEQEYQRSHPREAKVTLRLKSGKEYKEHVPNLRLMSASEVDDKFRKLATLVIDEGRSEKVLRMARNMDDLRDVSKIAPMLVPQQNELSRMLSQKG